MIGSQKYLLEKVKTAIEHPDKDLSNVAEALIDYSQIFFSIVDDWAKNRIRLKYVHLDKKTVLDHHAHSPAVMILQKKDAKMDTFDHILNIFMKDEDLMVHQEPETWPSLFICLNFPDQVLFIEEFMTSFLKQDYPWDKIHLQVTFASEEQRDTMLQEFQKLSLR